MADRWLLLTMIIGGASAAALFWHKTHELLPEERALFSKLELAISQTPPREADIRRAFGPFSKCRGITCFEKEGGRIGALRFSDRSLREQDDGFIFDITGFSGGCIRTVRVKSHFRTGEPKQSCMDGVCWHIRSQHDWGIMSFELESSNSPCVTSAIINTTPAQRGKSIGG
ncbi:hypothetical protein [Novosphingobium ginsenosidimutans]|uniref:hypothetical protein n=1 Tax=Novosphingobium ginsenosidimutans TaxID=1176536 RepID=UPI00137579EB|nr:hypothetical protein [Novosphingobium ginsenosidimutans]